MHGTSRIQTHNMSRMHQLYRLGNHCPSLTISWILNKNMYLSLHVIFILQSMVKNGKQAMVLFSLSVTGMNQGLAVSNRHSRAQRQTETPSEPQEEIDITSSQVCQTEQEGSEEQRCCKCKPIDADTIDIYARAVFPFTFAVVNVIYWVAYTMWFLIMVVCTYKIGNSTLQDELEHQRCLLRWRTD